MGILKRLKSVSLAFIPVIILIGVMHFVGRGFDTSLFVNFGIAVLLVILGEILFLQGVDSSMMNMGEIVGNSSNRISKFFIIIIFGFVFGLFATMSEPSVAILASSAVNSGLNVPEFLLLFSLSFGTGACVALGLLTIVARWNYKVVVAIFYAVIFIFCLFVPKQYIAIAFDGGGATISNIASPFLLALAAGVARNKAGDSRDSNFGMIGIASMGPVLAVLILGLIFGVSGSTEAAQSAASQSMWLETFFNICLSIIPLCIIFFIFQTIFVKIPKSEKIRILMGTGITFVGLYLFIVGINLGFLDMGKAIGRELLFVNKPVFSIALCAVMAFALCFSEPAVAILARQVEDLTNGNIKNKLVLVAIAIAFSLAVCLGICTVLFNWDVFVVLCIGYGIIFILMIFCSNIFTEIAFDSGGVTSGPMASSFIMPIMLGLAGLGNELEGFGVIAFIAMTPILIIEILGVIYQVQIKSKSRAENRRRKYLSTEEDELSNIITMEIKYKKLLEKEQSV